MSTIAFKIISPYNSKYIAPIRKHTNLGLIAIKNKIVDEELLAKVEGNHIEELEQLKELIEQLIGLGAQVQIFDSDIYSSDVFHYAQISLEELHNNIETLKEIEEDLKDYDDRLVDE
ncbi:hypothetical protein ACT6P6_01925 [Priestia endophytica]